MKTETSPHLVAIVGGSGAGKTWLADRLQRLIGETTARLSLDDFYLDRSDVPPAEREQINFDEPQAIDWPCIEQVLRDCRRGQVARVPRYDFASHTRRPGPATWQLKPLILFEGLWLLHEPAIRQLFDLSVFIDCPETVRLARRLARDMRERGRTEASVCRQFQATVAPMHERHVAPQRAWADLVLDHPLDETAVRDLARRLWMLVNATSLADAAGRARHSVRAELPANPDGASGATRPTAVKIETPVCV